MGLTLEKGNVKIEHYSTSSQLKITITSKNVQTDWGKYEDFVNELWLEYDQFENLKDIINQIKI